MSRTTKTIRKNKTLLTSYWGALTRQKTVSWEEGASKALLTSGDLASCQGAPLSFLKNDFPCNAAIRLLDALLQPACALTTDRIIMRENFLNLLGRAYKSGKTAPKLVKAVSYPSAARALKPGVTLESESFWMLDLFAVGMAYATAMGDPGSFIVLNTSIYEGWNVFNEKERDYIVAAKEGGDIVNRYREVLYAPSYAYIIANVNMRRPYVGAAARALKMPAVIDAERLMQETPFLTWLDRYRQYADKKRLPLFPRKSNGTFDFSPFVYAEERALQDQCGVDGYIGPLKEELQLNTAIAVMCGDKKDDAIMPYVWYTRPSQVPEMTFETDGEEVRFLLESDASLETGKYLYEILLRLGQLKTAAEFKATPLDHLICAFIGLRDAINRQVSAGKDCVTEKCTQ